MGDFMFSDEDLSKKESKDYMSLLDEVQQLRLMNTKLSQERTEKARKMEELRNVVYRWGGKIRSLYQVIDELEKSNLEKDSTITALNEKHDLLTQALSATCAKGEKYITHADQESVYINMEIAVAFSSVGNPVVQVKWANVVREPSTTDETSPGESFTVVHAMGQAIIEGNTATALVNIIEKDSTTRVRHGDLFEECFNMETPDHTPRDFFISAPVPGQGVKSSSMFSREFSINMQQAPKLVYGRIKRKKNKLRRMKIKWKDKLFISNMVSMPRYQVCRPSRMISEPWASRKQKGLIWIT